ncbi:GT-D fold domain-containing glycosyltransferase [Paenibacillus kobensis]|uniref:GT-D fold domain-containing glycosyltransferase n=1 Tax=Paenibacillus kobensis TaxID=59841 RepID=UPI001580481F|nr:GT-D fold domain-containing glycosyltransferase [Paenibacillus kobensis]
MSAYLNLTEVLLTIEKALRERSPLSLVRVGDGENIVLAQRSVWKMRRVLRERWAIKANKGEKGVTLPNIKLRNDLVRAIRRASIVGILPAGDDQIKAPAYLKRPLTNKVFAHFKLKPAVTCHACVNRMMPRTPLFWEILQRQRVLIVTRYPEPLKAVLESDPYYLHVTHTVAFSHYDQMDSAMKEIAAIDDEFDIALLSCGVNAVVLAPRIAAATGKVAIDFGKGPEQIGAAARKLKRP